MEKWDCIVIGAGAAGMFAAIEAGRRGRRVLVLDHARAPGEKIRISGGGRCNFTNIFCEPERFISANPRFATSALKRFTASDFVARVEAEGIAYHEKTLGQLFCDSSARDIIDMLMRDMSDAGVVLRLGQNVSVPVCTERGFLIRVEGQELECETTVVATGGKSIPKMGATGFGYRVAEAHGLKLEPTRPGLVPLTFSGPTLENMKALAGLSTDAVVSSGGASFREGLLFTHRGLSGPSILQVSSYWREGEEVQVEWLEEAAAFEGLRSLRQANGKLSVARALAEFLPKRLADSLLTQMSVTGRIGDMSDRRLAELASMLAHWWVLPAGSEGYRTAEVTVGGVSTAELDSKTMETRSVPGLYFIGEVVDVTGWLGGYNFQWAWSSGWAAGQVC
ncbi:aminoacetone oxidase family FAD-binding enzyme [Algicella marina]|uniref:Aminoacetone oxidase family FAD-binding enzyme n=1 Tax=Algicella marina TaxID=2683284 RepID=A0A6P1T6P4_9RHOB|nr:NAD(P)/FAD-dependent oxidoreductase [Algicella marina]QHQ37360.1 aminoacetone oxidase family FAD-binding enzyme [Algicella marina]